MRALSAIINVALVALYPAAIWWSLSRYSPRSVALIALGTLVPAMWIRFRSAKREDLWSVLRVPLVVMGVLLLAAVINDERLVLATPVLISVGLLLTFGQTLTKGQVPMIERFARLRESELSEAQQAHCRQTTWVWCAFFVLNAAIAGALALLKMRDAWALYTGLIAYGLMGTLFVGEYFLRQYRFRNYGNGLHDQMLKRLFPPRT